MARQPVEPGKARLRRRIVEIDRELVGEIEFELAERALRRRLLQPLAAVAGVDDLEAVAPEIAGMRPFLRPQLARRDRRRDVPRRVDHDAVDLRDQHRRLVARPAGHRLHRRDRGVAVEQRQHRRGDIDLDAVLLELGRQPAPALHIRHDLADARLDRHVEHRQRLRADAALRIEAVAALRPAHRIEQRVVEPVAGRIELESSIASRLRSAATAGALAAIFQLRRRRQHRPAAGRGDRAIARQPGDERVIAGIGRRQRRIHQASRSRLTASAKAGSGS